ncbi:hypothetical protein ACFLZK_01945 [Patescibacteria group bacterium]
MKRICPECNKPLENHSHYFCASCGKKLEESLVRPSNVFKTRVLEFVSEDSKKKTKKKKGKKKKEKKIKVVNKALNRQLAIGFVSVVVIGILAVGVIFLTRRDFKNKDNNSSQVTEEQVQEKPVEKPNSADLNLPQGNMNLANPNIIKYIPYDTDFYIIGSDLSYFHGKYFGVTATDDILPYISEYMEGRFITMGQKDGSDWMLTSVIYLKDKKVVDLTFEEIVVEGWFIQKVDDVLVVTNTEEMIQNVTDSSKGLARNIAQNPKTRVDSAQLPKEGQIIFVDINSEINALEELFYIFEPDVAALETLKDVVDLNPSKFVIRNDRE